jgi:selenide,water dikinase
MRHEVARVRDGVSRGGRRNDEVERRDAGDPCESELSRHLAVITRKAIYGQLGAPWEHGPRVDGVTATRQQLRLTQYAHGGGCACKIPPGELEDVLAELTKNVSAETSDLLVGLDSGDDAAAVRIDGDTAILATADFFTPVVDDAYDWGRIAATNALSDIYAMGGRPLVAVNLLAWPRDTLPLEVVREVLRGGLDIAREAQCHVAGGHSIDDPEPKYGMAVTGTAHPDRLLRNDAATPGLPISLTKPLGLGVLNNKHKATGEVFAEAIAVMTTLNREAARAAVDRGIRAATDVTGFGLLGHLHKMARASGITAVIDVGSVDYVDGARDAAAQGYVSGGTRRNLDWVRPHLDHASYDENELLLLADAQTSGGLLVAGEIPGAPVIGELAAAYDDGTTLVLR